MADFDLMVKRPDPASDFSRMVLELSGEAKRALTPAEQETLSGFLREEPAFRPPGWLAAFRSRLAPYDLEERRARMAPPTTATPSAEPPARTAEKLATEPPTDPWAAFQAWVKGRESETTKIREITAERRAQLEREQAELNKTLEAHQLQPVSLQPVPKPPTPKIRPFLEARGDESPMQLLGQVIQLTGLLATMGAAMKHAPHVGLRALTGALKGWEAGEREQAERDWHAWTASVEYMRLWNEREQQQLANAVQRRGFALQEHLLKSGYPKELYELSLKDPMAVLQWRDKMFTAGTSLWQLKETLELRKVQQRAEEVQRELLQLFKLDQREQAQERLELSRAAGKRAEEGLKMRKELVGLAKPVVQAVQQHQNLQLRRAVLSDLEWAVEHLNRKGLLTRGPSLGEQWRVWLAEQARLVDPTTAAALNILRRFGTSSLISAELSTGTVASVMRIKAIAEAEAGAVRGAPKAFWDQFLPKIKTLYAEQDKINQEQLKAVAPLVPWVSSMTGGPPPSVQDFGDKE